MPSIPIVTDRLKEAVTRFASAAPFASYIDPSLIVVTAQRGRSGPTGKRAECHFTRFRETRDRVSRDGRWRLPEVRIDGKDMRYIISFVFPRFLFLSPEEQAEDIVHELLHIDESFSGIGSARRHGPRYDAKVNSIARRALKDGIAVPHFANVGDVVYYRRFRPFPRPYRTSIASNSLDSMCFDERHLEVAALRLHARDKAPPPARYVYQCPVCAKLYPRQKPLRMASCGRCSDGYDARFKLALVETRAARTDSDDDTHDSRGRLFD